jgi:hypothetical protein
LGVVVPAVMKPARTLWHEVLGFVFVSMAIVFILSGLRVMHRFEGSPAEIFHLVMLALAALLLGGYGISSFLRARKISRS